MKNNPLVQHFIALVDGWNAAGWGEFLLWEVLEDLRPLPFWIEREKFAADLEVCRRLRDELQRWPYYSATISDWDIAPIASWRALTKTVTADSVRTQLENRR